MKKIFILLILLITVSIYTNNSSIPNINFSKIEYVSYSMNKSFTIDSIGVESSVQPNSMTVQIQVDYEFVGNLSLSRPTRIEKTLISSSETNKIKTEHRAETKKYHKGNNNQVLSIIDKTCYQDIYVSSYAPFIDITYDLEYFMKHQEYILELFTKNNSITNVTVIESYVDYENYIYYAVNDTGLGDVYYNRTKTGLGVVIGLLESGVVDTSHPNLQNSCIEVRSHILNVTRSKEHATEMAQMICGDYGMAPDALVLSAAVYGSTLTDEVEWMLDNNVDIINMSFGNANSLGTYDSMSAYVDYIMAENYVLVVASAGNNGLGDGYIDNPGLSYNAITTGAVNYDNSLAQYSSYEVISGPIKPTIGMYGTVDLHDADDTRVQGTSSSAALTTGMLSLVLQQYSTFVVNREQLYALMCANAIDPMDGYSYNAEENGFSKPLGAGVFNYANMISNYSNSGMTYSSGTVALNSPVYTKSIYLTLGQTLRFSIATIASSNGNVSGISFTDYDIFIYAPNGSIVKWANSSNSIIELAIYKAASSGTYRVEILQASERVKTRDYIGYAYRIYS